MDDFDFSVKDTDCLLFETKACVDASILPMQNNTDFQNELIKIIIGILYFIIYTFIYKILTNNFNW